MVKPFNDHLLVELPKNEWATADEQGDQQDPRASYGVVVDTPDVMIWLSSYTWVSDQSLANEKLLLALAALMKRLKGRRVYFEARAEIGNTIEDGDKRYATIKLSKITAVEE